MKNYHNLNLIRIRPEKIFFCVVLVVKISNLELELGVVKGLRLKVRKFCGLIPTFVEVTGEKLPRGPLCTVSSMRLMLAGDTNQVVLFLCIK